LDDDLDLYNVTGFSRDQFEFLYKQFSKDLLYTSLDEPHTRKEVLKGKKENFP
jgi:hypothetical protein